MICTRYGYGTSEMILISAHHERQAKSVNGSLKTDPRQSISKIGKTGGGGGIDELTKSFLSRSVNLS